MNQSAFLPGLILTTTTVTPASLTPETSKLNHTPTDLYSNITTRESYFSYNTSISYRNESNLTFAPDTVNNPITWVTYILFAVTSFFTALGLLGNSLILISMYKVRRNFNGHNVLITSLAVFDKIALISWVLTEPCVHDLLGIDVRAISKRTCKTAWAILFTTSFSSSAIVVLIGIARFVAVWFPLTTRRILSTKKMWKIVGSCVTPIVLIYTTMSVLYCEIKDGVCYPNLEGSEYSTVLNRVPNTTFYSASIGVILTLFMLILCVSTPLTVLKLHRQIVIRRRLTCEANNAHVVTSIKLMAIVVAQLIFNGIPGVMAVRFGLLGIIPDKNTMSALALPFVLNHSTNFLLYNIFDKQFRRNALALFGCDMKVKKSELQIKNCDVAPADDTESEYDLFLFSGLQIGIEK